LLCLFIENDVNNKTDVNPNTQWTTTLEGEETPFYDEDYGIGIGTSNIDWDNRIFEKL
jgi:hypothetical protein